MCQAKITDHWSNKYKCLLPDKYIITSIITGKDGKTRVRKKTLCDKHASTLRKNLNYRKKHLGGDLIYTQIEI